MSLTHVQQAFCRRLGHMVFGSIEPGAPVFGKKALMKNFGGTARELYHGQIPEVPRKYDTLWKERREFSLIKKEKAVKLAAKKAARKAAAAATKAVKK